MANLEHDPLGPDNHGHRLRQFERNHWEAFQMSAEGFMILAIRPIGPKTRRAPNGSF
jgi:hypothetical protein